MQATASGSAFMSSEVREIAAALAAVTDEELRGRFDPDRMNELSVEPGQWAAEDERLERLVEAFHSVRDSVALAARKRLGLITYAC
jgi:hypothetical protein